MNGIQHPYGMEIQGSLKTYRTLKKIYSRKYPWSLGLLYSAVTQLLGFKPNEEEYIVMGMGAYGEPKHKTMLKRKLDSENLHWGLNIKFDGKPEDLARLQCNQFTRMNYLNW